MGTITIPPDRWYGAAYGLEMSGGGMAFCPELHWDGQPLAIEPTEVTAADQDDRLVVTGWRTLPGAGERVQVMTVVDAAALPPHLWPGAEER